MSAWIEGHPTKVGAYWVQHEDGSVYLVVVDRRLREGAAPCPLLIDDAGNPVPFAKHRLWEWQRDNTDLLWCEPVGHLAWNRLQTMPYQIMRYLPIPRPESK